MTIIIFFVILAILILAHEFGHFIVAKKSGIRVDEFGLGFPPKIVGRKWGETEYSLNWLPLGGFVKIFGENPDTDSLTGTDCARSLTSKPRYIQAAVLLAGIVFNLLLAWILFSIGFMYGLPTSTQTATSEVVNQKLLVTGVLPNSPAAMAGLLPKDEIVSLVSGPDQLTNPTIDSVKNFVGHHGGQEVLVNYRRNPNPWQPESNFIAVATTTPTGGFVNGQAAIGVGLDEVGIMSLPILSALREGAVYTGELFVLTGKAFGNLLVGIFRDGKSALSAVTGPVGLVGMVGDARHLGLAYLLGFTALISVNLAVINLVPFPALDGGRLLFLAIEAIIRRPLKPEVVNWLNTAGFLLLIGLMVIVSYRDVLNLFVK